MNLYLVEHYDGSVFAYSFSFVIGVFSSRKTAIDVCEKYKEHDSNGSCCITEIIVDKVIV